MNRALKEQNSDLWINGRRRDHGAERAALPVWEGAKVGIYIIFGGKYYSLLSSVL